MAKRERPVQFYSKVIWNRTERQEIVVYVNLKLTFGFTVVEVKRRRHRFGFAELQPPFLEIRR